MCPRDYAKHLFISSLLLLKSMVFKNKNCEKRMDPLLLSIYPRSLFRLTSKMYLPLELSIPCLQVNLQSRNCLLDANWYRRWQPVIWTNLILTLTWLLFLKHLLPDSWSGRQLTANKVICLCKEGYLEPKR